MSDSTKKDQLISAIASIADASLDDLLDFSDNPDVEEILDRLGFAAHTLANINEVSSGKKAELERVIRQCRAAFKKKDYPHFSLLLFQFGMLYERSLSQSLLAKGTRDKKFTKDAPFVSYVLNRAIRLWDRDSNKNLLLPHMSVLLQEELEIILEGVKSELQGHINFTWLENYKSISSPRIKDWLERNKDVIRIPDYAFHSKNVPSNTYRKPQHERAKIARAHNYQIVEGKGLMFGSLLPIDCTPPEYE